MVERYIMVSRIQSRSIEILAHKSFIEANVITSGNNK